MSLNGLSIFITGAAGFIGSHLGNRLIEMGNAVYGLDSYFHATKNPLKFECERGDVRWPDLLLMRARNADAIIHLAAAINVDFSAADPESVYDVNLGGTLNILEAARKLDKKVVFASSSEIYGTAQERVMDEAHPLDGQSPYAASKIAADRACKAWQDAYGLKVNTVRLFNTFGPWQADDGYGGVIAKFSKQCLAGKPMTVYGQGDQRRDYLWIDDAVNAYLLALERDFNGPVNFGTGTTVSIRELASSIAVNVYGGKIADVKSLWEFGPERRGEVDCLRCDASKAKEMGWEPTVGFQDGLKRYMEFMR